MNAPVPLSDLLRSAVNLRYGGERESPPSTSTRRRSRRPQT
jgi:hypothetical protein